MSKKKLDVQEAVHNVCEAADSLCAFIIDRYFDGNVSRFYDAPHKFEEFHDPKTSPLKKNATYATVYADLQHYNWVGIQKKYIRALVGHNYDNAEFMADFRSAITQLGYVIKLPGTFWYNGKDGKKRHPYYAKYLPPKSKLEAIFSDRKYAKRVARSSSYNNRVRNVLAAIRNEYVPEETKKKYQRKPSKKLCEFTSADNLMNKLFAVLKAGNAGSPASFLKVLKPIVTEGYCSIVKEFWKNDVSQSVKNKYDQGYLEDFLKIGDLKTVYETQLEFFKKIYKQINGPYASKMFKDEWLKKDEDGKDVWKSADENRIAEARCLVREKVEFIKGRLAVIADVCEADLNAADKTLSDALDEDDD